MKKDSKNLGITKSCPICKKVVFRGLIFDGNASSETIKCPHCQTILMRTISKKMIVTFIQLTILIVIIFLSGVFIFGKSMQMETLDNAIPLYILK